MEYRRNSAYRVGRQEGSAHFVQETLRNKASFSATIRDMASGQYIHHLKPRSPSAGSLGDRLDEPSFYGTRKVPKVGRGYTGFYLTELL